MGARELAVRASRPDQRMLRGSQLRVQILLLEPLMVDLLLRVRVPGNRIRRLVNLRHYAS